MDQLPAVKVYDEKYGTMSKNGFEGHWGNTDTA
jgi:hypothetical protein